MLAYRPPPAEETQYRAAQPSYRPTASTTTRSAAPPIAPFASRPHKQSSSSRTALSAAAQPPAPAAAIAPPPPPAAPAASDKPKSDKGKLTEQWGPPPNLIRRDNDWLQRGQLLGEVSSRTTGTRRRRDAHSTRSFQQGGFARVYLSTEPDGVTTKALKVIAKEQLKSTKNKSKVSLLSFNETHPELS